MIPKYQFLIYYQKQIYLLEFFTDFVYRNNEFLIIICQFLDNWQIILILFLIKNYETNKLKFSEMEKAREKKLIADILAMLISYIDSYLIES